MPSYKVCSKSSAASYLPQRDCSPSAFSAKYQTFCSGKLNRSHLKSMMLWGEKCTNAAIKTFVAVFVGPQGVKEGKKRTLRLFNKMMPTALCEIGKTI